MESTWRRHLPGSLEALFRTYAAGYFAFGWSGMVPHPIRLLVLAGRETDESRTASAS